MKTPKRRITDLLNETAQIEAASEITRRDVLIAELRKQKTNLLDHIHELRGASDLFIAASRPAKKLEIKSDPKRDKADATVVACANDWHVGETVKEGSVNGLNRFTLEIAEERIERYFKNTLKVTNTLRGASRIETMVFAPIGDIISGYLREESRETNPISPSEEIFFARQCIGAGLRYWLRQGDFKRIVVPCVVGNHGRTTIKPRHSTLVENSFEWILYRILEADFKDEPRIEWQISDGQHEYLSIYGVIFRFHHGDKIKGGGGIGGVSVPLLRMIAKWNENIHADISVNGHFHLTHDLRNAVMSGSLIGPSAHSLALGCAFEPPQQSLILVDSEYQRKVMVTPIHCETPEWIRRFRKKQA